MVVTLDNIIFELQSAGGISKVWAKQLANLPRTLDLQMIEGPGTGNNLFRRNLALPGLRTVPDRNIPLVLRRYLTAPDCGGSVFHSSYYRLPGKPMPTVVTVHDFMYELFDKGLRKHIHMLQKGRAIRHATAIICVSEHTRSDLLRFHPECRTKPIHVIHNGVDDEFSAQENPQPELVAGDRTLEQGRFALYVGSRGYCKDFPTAARLFGMLRERDPQMKLLVVGGPPLGPEDESLFTDAGIDKQDAIIHVGEADNAFLNEAYNLAFALLFPSRYEGFGIPALEAARCGCPVIAARTSSVPEVLGQRYPLFFDPEDESSIRQVIERASDPAARHDAAAYGLEHSADFSWAKCGSRVADVYLDTAGTQA